MAPGRCWDDRIKVGQLRAVRQLRSDGKLTLKEQSDQQQENWTRTSTKDLVGNVNWDLRWERKERKKRGRVSEVGRIYSTFSSDR